MTDTAVIVTSEPNRITCLNRVDGKIAWEVKVLPSDLLDENSQKQAAEYRAPEAGSGEAAATPITDGKNIFAVFANGIVRAVTLDGKANWGSYINAEQNTGYGRSSSPILAAGKLIVHMTNLYALNPDTGAILWTNTKAESTYGTPAAIRIGDTDGVITSGGDLVRVSNGESLGSDLGRCTHSSPIVNDGVIFSADATIKALRISTTFAEKELWSYDIAGGAGTGGDVFGSPLFYDGIIFVVTGKGELFSFDADGKGAQNPIINARALFGEGGTAQRPATYSSLTLAGKYIFLSSNQGETVVLEAIVMRRKLLATACQKGLEQRRCFLERICLFVGVRSSIALVGRDVPHYESDQQLIKGGGVPPSAGETPAVRVRVRGFSTVSYGFHLNRSVA